MAKITNEMVKCSYEVAKEVYSGKFSRSEGKTEISSLTGMGIGSANDYITVLLEMLRGKEYHRTINTFATEYYLENILNDFGQESLTKALSAVKGHVKYYATLGHGNLVSIEDVASKFE
ncbi:hypothetical protein [Acetobacterium bakii]|uniref:Uncharacterized protein n=1 Tax=Acetobacterium bakii TaxID=52689 RepID=A0A0L6TWG1_9FIRM|nr:hypothetical protein [Acetobacterium bakii]KNZ40614.1 hypothetical protein AKG39_16865 [Acetobacterium bakii]